LKSAARLLIDSTSDAGKFSAELRDVDLLSGLLRREPLLSEFVRLPRHSRTYPETPRSSSSLEDDTVTRHDRIEVQRPGFSSVAGHSSG
jgi:hypothetical protein